MCAKVSSPTCTLIVTILFPFIQPVNCRKTKRKTYKASMKLTRGPCTISSGREICVPSSFFALASCACCCKAFFRFFFFAALQPKCGLLLSRPLLDWERYRFLFLQVESYKYAMYLWSIIHSTINNRAFKSVADSSRVEFFS